MTKNQSMNVVEAEEFRLLDNEGRVRAKIFLEEGEPKVALFSKENKKRAAIGLLATGEAGVALYDDRGAYHFLINVSAEGDTDLSIRDKQGREVNVLQAEGSTNLESEILPEVKSRGLRWLLRR